MNIESQQEAYDYMRNIMMLNAGEYGYRKFSLAWESEEDKESSRACRLADFAGVAHLVNGNWIDDDFMSWVDRAQSLGDGSMCLNIALWLALLESNVAETFLDDVEVKKGRNFVMDRLYKTLGIETGIEFIRRRLVFCDGESISVQASAQHHSSPHDDVGPYIAVEVGFPSFVDPRLIPYALDEEDPLDTTYHYVPTTLLAEVIREHGGVIKGELPPMRGL